MAQNDKKGFLMYADYISWLNLLSNEQAGIVLKQILEFVNYGTELETDDQAVKMAWNVIRNNLIRDHEKYLEKLKQSQLGGILKSIRDGKKLKLESIQFLDESGCLTFDFLVGKGIPDDKVEYFLNNLPEQYDSDYT